MYLYLRYISKVSSPTLLLTLPLLLVVIWLDGGLLPGALEETLDAVDLLLEGNPADLLVLAAHRSHVLGAFRELHVGALLSAM